MFPCPVYKTKKSSWTTPGSELIVCESPIGKLGLSVVCLFIYFVNYIYIYLNHFNTINNIKQKSVMI